ncbi:hypothetical protein Hanom_Chr09g00832561 [Helianthus anomalus]
MFFITSGDFGLDDNPTKQLSTVQQFLLQKSLFSLLKSKRNPTILCTKKKKNYTLVTYTLLGFKQNPQTNQIALHSRNTYQISNAKIST